MPKRRHHLKADQPLLVGRLRLGRGNRFRPLLMIDVWCPHCKREHNHGWEEPPFLADRVEHRCAHCGSDSPFARAGYWIGLDPAAKAENAEVIATFKEALAAWQRHHCRPVGVIPVWTPEPSECPR